MRSESARARWAFLLIISLGLFIVAADNSILYVALPTLRAELHTSHQQGLWIINAYPLVLAGHPTLVFSSALALSSEPEQQS